MTIENYKWIPKQGPSTEAIDRMCRKFSMPKTPMGEAWFISDVRLMFTDLIDQPLAEISNDYLEKVLYEIASGTSCFGHLKEWDEWFRFLLPHVILRTKGSHKGDTISELLVTASFNIFDQGITDDYPNFRDDVIQTATRCIMKPELWIELNDETTRQKTLRPIYLVDSEDDPQNTGRWWCSSTIEEVSAAMFFCLRFLEPQEIITWVESLTEIEDIFWKAHLLVWLVGFDELTPKLPFKTNVFERFSPTMKWRDSFLVDAWKEGKEFFPPENIKTFWEEINRQITAEKLLQWVDEFAAHPSLADKNYFYIPEIYFDKIICKQS